MLLYIDLTFYVAIYVDLTFYVTIYRYDIFMLLYIDLTWAFYLLAEHEDVQDKVYKEITNCYKGGPITAETMKNMK